MNRTNIEQGTLRVLHLSDIHFGIRKDKKTGDTRSAHHFVTGKDLVPDPLRLARLLTDIPASPRALIISGDIGWSGTQADYAYAIDFIARIRERWQDVEVILAPGNHDVDLGNGTTNDDRQSAFTDFARTVHGDNFDHVFPFFKWGPAAALQPRERLVAFHKIDSRATIVCVNSAAYINDPEKHGVPIYVSAELLRLVTEYLVHKHSYFDEGHLRIFVMHHHLLPFAEPRWEDSVDYGSPPREPDSTIVANSAHLQVWLARNQFDIVLHGHKHMPHGRSDRLWRRASQDTFERHTLVVGAGTAGVAQDHVPRNEGLSVNELKLVRIDTDRWTAKVDVRGLFPDEPGRPVQNLFSYSVETGKEPSYKPATFVSTSMAMCHQAMAERHQNHRGPLRNFVSVVTAPEFELPASACIGSDSVTKDQVENCFRALHPEFDSEYGWGKDDVIQAKLQALSHRFAFQHGPRIFGIPGRSGPWPTTPALRALKALDFSNTRGYVSLINVETDVLGDADRQPTPGLVGVQFVRNGAQLDIVATFRSIELSFWWVVNMYEMCELLKWATQKKGMPRGTITFFSPFAEWRDDPRPSFRTDIDEMSVSSLADLALTPDPDELKRLIGLLEQKIRHTSVFDLDPRGLQNLADLLCMQAATAGPALLTAIANDIVVKLRRAVIEIKEAMRLPADRASHVEVATRLLGTIVDSLSNRHMAVSNGH